MLHRAEFIVAAPKRYCVTGVLGNRADLRFRLGEACGCMGTGDAALRILFADINEDGRQHICGEADECYSEIDDCYLSEGQSTLVCVSKCVTLCRSCHGSLVMNGLQM